MSSHKYKGIATRQCRICLSTFRKRKNLVMHMKRDHGEGFTCDICQKKYSDIYTIRAHMKKVHIKSNLNAFICPKCGRSFNCRSKMNHHEKTNCNQTAIFKCKICDKAYITHSGLRCHVLKHSDKLPHVCSICGKGFINNYQLKKHERRHNGEKPHACEVCGKRFSHKETLNTHASVHTGIKPYFCQGCGDRFSCISNLKAHRRSRQDTCALLPIITSIKKLREIEQSTPKVCLTFKSST